MKKILSLAAAFLFVSTVCFAQPAPTAPMKSMTAEVSYVSGKVLSIIPADAAKGTKMEITLTDAAGKEVKVMVGESVIVFDKDGNKTTMDMVVMDKDITVKCKAGNEAVKEAIAIKLK